MLITPDMLDLSSVTPEMIGRAYKCFDEKGIPFYMVESSRDLFDDEELRVEYKVTWDQKHGFQCTCPSGQEGFANCTFQKVCQHVLSAVAAAKEEHEAFYPAATSQRAFYLEINGKEASDKEYARVMLAQAKDTRKAPLPDVYNRKPFTLM